MLKKTTMENGSTGNSLEKCGTSTTTDTISNNFGLFPNCSSLSTLGGGHTPMQQTPNHGVKEKVMSMLLEQYYRDAAAAANAANRAPPVRNDDFIGVGSNFLPLNKLGCPSGAIPGLGGVNTVGAVTAPPSTLSQSSSPNPIFYPNPIHQKNDLSKWHRIYLDSLAAAAAASSSSSSSTLLNSTGGSTGGPGSSGLDERSNSSSDLLIVNPLDSSSSSSTGPPIPPQSVDMNLGRSSFIGNDNYVVNKPRMRVCFDPETEIPRLQKWFSENNHPTRQQVEEFVKELNSLENRKGRKALDVNNVIYWFKNTRAAVKRAEMKNRQNNNAAAVSAAAAVSSLSPKISSYNYNSNSSSTANPGGYYNNWSSWIKTSSKLSQDFTNIDKLSETSKKDWSLAASPASHHQHQSTSSSPLSAHPPLSYTPPPLPASSSINKETSSSVIMEAESSTNKTDDEDEVDEDDDLMDDNNSNKDDSTSKDDKSEYPSHPQPLNIFNQSTNPLLSHSVIYMSQYMNPYLQGSTTSSSPTNSSLDPEKRKRNRTFIDPVSEVPTLEEWFNHNTHPSHAMIARYTEELNKLPYRQKFPPLEQKNIQFWFKNRRAKCKRMNSSCLV